MGKNHKHNSTNCDTKECKGCGEDLLLSSFGKYFEKRQDKFYCYSRCFTCQKEYESRRHKLYTYSLTNEELDKLLIVESCQICDTPFIGVTKHIDHCHTTDKVRGVLCSTCNQGIGLLKEDPKIMLNAIKYLNGKK